MDNLLKKNIAELKKLNEDQIKAILLEGFSTNNFRPLYFHAEPSVTLQLYYIFADKEFNGTIKETFKQAIVRAVNEWTVLAYGTRTIKELAILVAYVRVSRAVERLKTILLENQLVYANDEEEYLETVEVILAALSDFMPECGELFEHLFYDEFDYRFKSQLFLGLCEYKRDNYVEYVKYFLETANRFPEEYDIEYVFKKFREIVSDHIIKRHIHELEEPYESKLLFYMLLSSCEIPLNISYPPPPDTLPEFSDESIAFEPDFRNFSGQTQINEFAMFRPSDNSRAAASQLMVVNTLEVRIKKHNNTSIGQILRPMK